MDLESQIQKIQEGERRALSQAITLIESKREGDRLQAETLLEGLVPLTGNSIRVGISGVPGVGKSTFIESLGLHLIVQGFKVAVLAIDPSSQMTGGSILADKTRMPLLAAHEKAFIRPTPSSGTLGGVAERTREVMALCEAAGFDIILIETVGVGQSETHVYDLTDLVLLLLAPACGDDLQGIKKGIVEVADLVVVNKADGALQENASETQRFYQNALHLLTPRTDFWVPPVLTVSSLERTGLSDVWEKITEYAEKSKAALAWDQRRSQQQLTWFRRLLREEILRQAEARLGDKIQYLENEIRDGHLSPFQAAREGLGSILTSC